MTDDTMVQSSLGSNFQFSGTRTEHLGASEYTLVNIGVDVSGSVKPFKDGLLDCLKAAVTSCKKSARADNLLVRVFLFSQSLHGGIEEIHGFKPLADIDPAAYPELFPNSGTPLFDAAYSAVGATNAYAEQLYNDDYSCNAINFIITDGDDTSSTMSPAAVKREVDKALQSEHIESIVNVLVGINAASCKSYLQQFQTEAGFDKYIDAGDVTPQKLAKLADFVSQSISSQSQSLGTGGASQSISATI